MKIFKVKFSEHWLFRDEKLLVSIFQALSSLFVPQTHVRFIYEKMIHSLLYIIEGVARGAAINPPTSRWRRRSGVNLVFEPWNQLDDLLQINFHFPRLNEYLGNWLIEYSRITPHENGIFSGKFVPSIWVEIEYISLKSERQRQESAERQREKHSDFQISGCSTFDSRNYSKLSTFQTLKFELSVLKRRKKVKLIVENSSLRLCTLTLRVNAWSHKTQHPYLLKNRIYYPCFAANFQLPPRVCSVTTERLVSIHFTPSRFGKTWPRQNFMGWLIVARH